MWIAAEAIGLSGILTLVAFAMTMARRGGPQMPARMRVPIFAVWETVVFVLNAFAFVLIGMQLRPIWQRLDAGGARADAVVTAAVVLGVTIAARFAWVMSYNALMRRRHDRAGEARSSAADGRQRHRGLVGRHARHRHAGRGIRHPRDAAERSAVSVPRPDPALRVRGRARHAGAAGTDDEAADPAHGPD